MTKYFRLQVYSPSRGLVYQKDFNVILMFDRFVRLFVSELVESRILQPKEQYSARIVPKYDYQAKFNAEFYQEEAEQPAAFQDNEGWLGMTYIEDINPEEPMTYFTLEVCTAPRQKTGKYFSYRRDLRLSELNHFKRRIDTVLCSQGVINDDEETEHLIFARHDDRANFDKDIVYTSPDMDAIKIEIHKTSEREWQKRRFDAYNAEQVGTPAENDLKILILQTCLQRLQETAAAQRNRSIEIGGVLLGEVYQEETTEEFLIEIHDFIPAESTQATNASLLFTHESWSYIAERRKKHFPDKTTVGWYHTHPFKTQTNEGGTLGLSIFFSQMDGFVHKTFFKELWHVAMVLGYEGQEKGFFQWRDGKIESCGGFYIYEGVNGDD